MAVPGAIVVHEIELPELLGTGFDAATARWRGIAPALVVTPVAGTAGVRLVNLLAPRGQAFWAAASVPSLAAHRLARDTATRSAIKEVQKGLPKADRADKASGPGTPAHLEWLQPIFEDLWDGCARSVRSLCEHAPTFRELGRRRACIVAAGALDCFIVDQDALLAELGAQAFFGTDERSVMLDGVEPASVASCCCAKCWPAVRGWCGCSRGRTIWPPRVPRSAAAARQCRPSTPARPARSARQETQTTKLMKSCAPCSASTTFKLMGVPYGGCDYQINTLGPCLGVAS